MYVSLDNSSKPASYETANKALQTNGLLLNHAEWCGHCVHFMPEWKKIVTKLKKKKNFNVVDIESASHNTIRSNNKKMFNHITQKNGKEQVLYYPMIILYKEVAGKIKKIMFDGKRTEEGVLEFIDKHLKTTTKKSKATTKPLKGGSDNFQQVATDLVNKFFKIS